jgi:hypothetical protein
VEEAERRWSRWRTRPSEPAVLELMELVEWCQWRRLSNAGASVESGTGDGGRLAPESMEEAGGV